MAAEAFHSFVCIASNYKSVSTKVRPGNEAMPQNIFLPFYMFTLYRYPDENPLPLHPPAFKNTACVTRESLALINFGPEIWLSEQEIK